MRDPGAAVPGARARESPARYYDARFGRDIVKIKPGEYYATTENVIVATVLGSCVAACIRDTVRGGAGMNHFMLPDPGPGASAADGASLRYGVHAMESLIGQLVKRGAQRRDLEAKVFGGASVVDAISGDIGPQNACFVLDYLAAEGIKTAACDLGGTAPRRVLFNVEDGRVLVKYLWRLTNDTIARREAEYARSVKMQRASTVDLF